MCVCVDACHPAGRNLWHVIGVTVGRPPFQRGSLAGKRSEGDDAAVSDISCVVTSTKKEQRQRERDSAQPAGKPGFFSSPMNPKP